MKGPAAAAHWLKNQVLGLVQPYEPRGRGFESCRARHFSKDLAYQNQVLLPTVGPLWDPLSTGAQLPPARILRRSAVRDAQHGARFLSIQHDLRVLHQRPTSALAWSPPSNDWRATGRSHRENTTCK